MTEGFDTGEGSDRLRTPPVERFAGTEHVFDLGAAAAALRDENHPGIDGHRQVSLFHRDGLSLVTFDFEPGGCLADHSAEAYVTILAVAGSFEVSTPSGVHSLPAGSLIVMAPGIVHSVTAGPAGQILLIVDLAAAAVSGTEA